MGPFDDVFTSIAMIRMNGEAIISPRPLQRMSKNLFKNKLTARIYAPLESSKEEIRIKVCYQQIVSISIKRFYRSLDSLY